ncbi:hypothetical protein Tcan_12501 [Toxocara canis]|uniref:Uncharacterized protein n=1 Tax=Toxocara canis TaxID=6265 RepID=A0A0B2VAH8_TOXCA|nr:hypothetical protein Tcan_12501 [Toxocara canis]
MPAYRRVERHSNAKRRSNRRKKQSEQTYEEETIQNNPITIRKEESAKRGKKLDVCKEQERPGDSEHRYDNRKSVHSSNKPTDGINPRQEREKAKKWKAIAGFEIRQRCSPMLTSAAAPFASDDGNNSTCNYWNSSEYN